MAKHYVEVEFPVILTVLVETDDVDEILEKGEQLACNAIEKLAHLSLTENLIDYNLTVDTVGYYYEGEITGFELTVEGDKFSLFFEINEDDAYQYEIEITPHAVGEFLDQLAEQCNRNDCFDIQTNY